MPAPADKTGVSDAGFPRGNPPRPEPTPRAAGSGSVDPRANDAMLSPYLRRRLRSLAEALRDSAGRGEAGRPATGAASPSEAEGRGPETARKRAPREEDRHDDGRSAVVETFGDGRAPLMRR